MKCLNYFAIILCIKVLDVFCKDGTAEIIVKLYKPSENDLTCRNEYPAIIIKNQSFDVNIESDRQLYHTRCFFASKRPLAEFEKDKGFLYVSKNQAEATNEGSLGSTKADRNETCTCVMYEEDCTLQTGPVCFKRNNAHLVADKIECTFTIKITIGPPTKPTGSMLVDGVRIETTNDPRARLANFYYEETKLFKFTCKTEDNVKRYTRIKYWPRPDKLTSNQVTEYHTNNELNWYMKLTPENHKDILECHIADLSMTYLNVTMVTLLYTPTSKRVHGGSEENGPTLAEDGELLTSLSAGISGLLLSNVLMSYDTENNNYTNTKIHRTVYEYNKRSHLTCNGNFWTYGDRSKVICPEADQNDETPKICSFNVVEKIATVTCGTHSLVLNKTKNYNEEIPGKKQITTPTEESPPNNYDTKTGSGKETTRRTHSQNTTPNITPVNKHNDYAVPPHTEQHNHDIAQRPIITAPRPYPSNNNDTKTGPGLEKTKKKENKRKENSHPYIQNSTKTMTPTNKENEETVVPDTTEPYNHDRSITVEENDDKPKDEELGKEETPAGTLPSKWTPYYIGGFIFVLVLITTFAMLHFHKRKKLRYAGNAIQYSNLLENSDNPTPPPTQWDKEHMNTLYAKPIPKTKRYQSPIYGNEALYAEPVVTLKDCKGFKKTVDKDSKKDIYANLEVNPSDYQNLEVPCVISTPQDEGTYAANTSEGSNYTYLAGRSETNYAACDSNYAESIYGNNYMNCGNAGVNYENVSHPETDDDSPYCVPDVHRG